MKNKAPLHFDGSLQMNYEDEEEEGSRNCTVTSAVKNENSLRVEFQGTSSEFSGRVVGSMMLALDGKKVTGTGRIVFADGDAKAASVTAGIFKLGEELSVEGEWLEQGDAKPWSMAVHLTKVKAESLSVHEGLG